MSANDRQHGGDHYKNGKLEHWDVCERYGIGYLESAGTKYLSRWRNKAGLLDLDKSLHYLDKLIDLVAEGVRLPRGIVPRAILTMFFEAQQIQTKWEESLLTQFFRWETLEDLVRLRDDLADFINVEGKAYANS